MWDINILVEDSTGYIVSDPSGETYYMTYSEYETFKKNRKERDRKNKFRELLDD